jgi:hypothetical protein
VAGISDANQADRRPTRRSGKDPPERCPVTDDPKYQLSDAERAWVARTVDSLGPLTAQQRDILSRLLHRRV